MQEYGDDACRHIVEIIYIIPIRAGPEELVN